VFTQVKTAVDKVKAAAQGLGDRVVEDKRFHASRLCRRRSGYATPAGFGGFDLKTMGNKFDAFGPQSSEDLGATRPHVASSETLNQGEASS
jgi:hypothetical protein